MAMFARNVGKFEFYVVLILLMQHTITSGQSNDSRLILSNSDTTEVRRSICPVIF